MNDIESKLAALESKLARIDLRLDNDFRSLYGNGHPGLIDRMNEIEKHLAKRSGGLAAVSQIVTLLLSLTAIACNVIAMLKK